MKLNMVILDEDEYIELVEGLIRDMSQHPPRNDNVDFWWENLFKPGLKRVSIYYRKKRICEHRSKRKLLQSQLEETVNSGTSIFHATRNLNASF